MAYCTFHTLFHQLSSSCQKEEDLNANVDDGDAADVVVDDAAAADDDDDADISLLLPASQQYSHQLEVIITSRFLLKVKPQLTNTNRKPV